MKVLRVLYELRPSGVEAHLRSTAPLWNNEDIDIDILAIGPTQGPFVSSLEASGYRVHHIPLEPFHKFLIAYSRLLAEEQFDIVHVHPEKANFYVAGMARLFGSRAVVRSVHNVFPFTGRLGLERRIQRRILRWARVHHISISKSVQESEHRHFGNPTQLIYNSYDDSRFYPPTPEQRRRARAGIEATADEFIVVTVGNCARAKNHEALLEAIAMVQASLPVRYLHVGIEPPSRPEYVLAIDLGLNGRVDFLGQVDDVPSILHAADCYVMPSRHEGLGNAALEALACGLPSVLADVPGLSDLNDYFESCVWWVQPEAPAVARALIQLAALDSRRREGISTQVAARALEHFRARRAVKEYAEMYRTLHARRQGTPLSPRVWRMLMRSRMREPGLVTRKAPSSKDTG